MQTLPREGLGQYPAPPGPWPQHGRISFRKVAMRYRDDTPLIFQDLSFDVHEAEKIGGCWLNTRSSCPVVEH